MEAGETQQTQETFIRRNPWSVLAVVLSVFFAARVVADALNDKVLGIDFGVFHAGGSLISSEGFEAAYDTDRFTEVLAANYFAPAGEGANVSVFISTPTFGWFAQALAWLPFTPSLTIWYIAGLLLLVPACRMLSLPNWVAAALLISPMMAVNTIFGQTGLFVLVLFIGLHIAHRENRLVLAGLLAGLIVVKPVLAVGYGLLWLVQFRTYARSIAVALVTGAFLSIPTVIGGLGPWQSFLGAMEERADAESNWVQQAPSVSEFVKLLFPQSESWITLTSWGLGLVVGAAFLMAANRRFGHDAEIMSAAAIIASVLASPHLLTYDTMILVIPVAVAYSRGLLTGDRGGMLFAIIAVSYVLGPVLYIMQFEILGRGIGLELPAVLLCSVLLVRWDSETSEDSGLGSDRLDAVLADA